MKKVQNAVYAGLAFTLMYWVGMFFSFDWMVATMSAPFAGLLFGVVMYFFSTSKKIEQQTQVSEDGKTILHSGMANHFKGIEAVGGRLFLFNDKLHFKSHNLNVQNHELVMPLNDIKEVTGMGWWMPNGLKVITANGNTEKFVLQGRKQWEQEIGKAKQNLQN